MTASAGGTLAEHLPHHPKVKGSSPAPGTKNGRENDKKIIDIGISTNTGVMFFVTQEKAQ